MSPSSDLLPPGIRSRLTAHVFAHRIYYAPELDSTNRLAGHLARSGEAHGTMVIADHQTRGRGRHDRRWVSEAKQNLLFSLILRPKMSLGAALPVTLAFSLSIAETLEAELNHRVEVKWPNDVVVGGRKICGILSESSSRAGRTVFVVVGVGVNVNTRADEFPAEIRERATSCFALTHNEHDRAGLLGKLLGGLEATYERFARNGFGDFVASYNNRLTVLNKTVAFVSGGERASGLVTGVIDDGGLAVSKSDHTRVVLYDEDVTLLE